MDSSILDALSKPNFSQQVNSTKSEAVPTEVTHNCKGLRLQSWDQQFGEIRCGPVRRTTRDTLFPMFTLLSWSGPTLRERKLSSITGVWFPTAVMFPS